MTPFQKMCERTRRALASGSRTAVLAAVDEAAAAETETQAGFCVLLASAGAYGMSCADAGRADLVERVDAAIVLLAEIAHA